MKIKGKFKYIISTTIILFVAITLAAFFYYRSGASQFGKFSLSIKDGMYYLDVHKIAISSGFKYVVIVSNNGKDILRKSELVHFTQDGHNQIKSEEYYFTGVLYNSNIFINYNSSGYVNKISGSN